MSGRRPPREAGLQAERTSLAWSRTALTVLVNAALVIRTGAAAHAPLTITAGTLLALAALGVALAGRWRAERLLRDHETRSADAVVTAVFTVASLCTVTVLAVIALT